MRRNGQIRLVASFLSATTSQKHLFTLSPQIVHTAINIVGMRKYRTKFIYWIRREVEL